jgi:RNA polymerase-binding protein DksA
MRREPFVTSAELSSANQRHFQQLLFEQKRALRLQLQDALVRLSDERRRARQGDVQDTKDEAMLEEVVEAVSADVSRLRDELAAVEYALERAAAGLYGHCIQCGQPIALDRLHSQPSAIRCWSCQTSREHSAAAPTAESP